MLGYFNDWNTIQLTNKNKSSEDFDEVNKVVLDGISANMSSLVQTGKYGAINAADPTKLGYYVVKYVSDTFILQEQIIPDGKVIKAGEMVGRSEYLSIIKDKTNWY